MIVESVYSSKFILLEPFFEEIFTCIKKEIKREITIKGSVLQRKLGVQSVRETKEMIELFSKSIITLKEEEVAEWAACAWINKHGDIFHLFHEFLVKVSSNYDELTEIPSDTEEEMIKKSSLEFGFFETYVFSILNSVVFSEKALSALRSAALAWMENKRKQQVKPLEISSEQRIKDLEERLEKMVEKHEKKVLGITEKYRIEIEGYRKQIGKLQKKLEELCAKS